jgi:hypothetical protein
MDFIEGGFLLFAEELAGETHDVLFRLHGELCLDIGKWENGAKFEGEGEDERRLSPQITGSGDLLADDPLE